MKKRRFYDSKIRYRKDNDTNENAEAQADITVKSEREAEDEEIRKKLFSKDSVSERRRRSQRKYSTAVMVICSILLILTGFIGADVYMIRHASPLSRISEEAEKENDDVIGEIDLEFKGAVVPSISLDGSIMLSSVIEDMQKGSKTAVVFDAKRADGTIGYESTLSTVETLGLKSSQGVKPRESVSQLVENDLLPIARVYVYLDGTVPLKSSEMAFKQGKKVYTDENGATYLDPNSELVYGYIKEVVNELHDYGISFFILDGCKVGDKDYFGDISAKLQKEIGGRIRFFEAVEVKLTGIDAESGDVNSAGIKSGIEKFPKLNKNQVYIIDTDLKESKYSTILTQKKYNRYVVES